MRGLKLRLGWLLVLAIRRIFYRCVDWNLRNNCETFADKWSHLLQMRGLKPPADVAGPIMGTSHLLQMRGLKHGYENTNYLFQCRIFYRCVDWNTNMSISFSPFFSRIFYRCVDWNRLLNLVRIWIRSHLLQMRGLKHQKMIAQRQHDVASFTDAWIETTFTIKRYTFTVCRIFYRCVDWNILIVLHSYLFLGRIFYRCVDWNRSR